MWEESIAGSDPQSVLCEESIAGSGPQSVLCEESIAGSDPQSVLCEESIAGSDPQSVLCEESIAAGGDVESHSLKVCLELLVLGSLRSVSIWVGGGMGGWGGRGRKV